MGTLRFLVICWLTNLCVVGVDTAVAQTWPAARPVTMVVPFPPGPALDLVARLVGGKISDALGQTVVVENRSGANGTMVRAWWRGRRPMATPCWLPRRAPTLPPCI